MKNALRIVNALSLVIIILMVLSWSHPYVFGRYCSTCDSDPLIKWGVVAGYLFFSTAIKIYNLVVPASGLGLKAVAGLFIGVFGLAFLLPVQRAIVNTDIYYYHVPDTFGTLLMCNYLVDLVTFVVNAFYMSRE